MTTLALAVLLSLPAAAQSPWGVAVDSAPAVSSAPAAGPALGNPLPVTGGPWVPAEFLFFSNGRVVSDYAWRDKLRGRRDVIYTSADLSGDVEALLSLKVFDKVTPAVYGIPGTQVAADLAPISVSSQQVRVVFDVLEKPKPEAPKTVFVTPPTAVGGVFLTPTAYRGAGRHTNPGLALDINAAYFIGRLYGKNSFPNSPRKSNYIDRIGLWTLTADGKMQVQSETSYRPAVAVGGQAMLVFRDSPQPTVQTPGVSVKIDAKNTRVLTDGYFVASKKFGPIRTSAGVMQGTMGELAAELTEFLRPEALRFYANKPGAEVHSRTVPFGSAFYLLKPDFPIGVEFMKFNGAPLNPYLINFKLGRFLKLNFDLALIKFQGGYDLLGVFQFRYNHFPKN
ncbi:MAG: hypothetical protein SF051_12730 [Elusimicrobiota bacterium]|nr:hypothetical protein [Elusimicrobiota bacterium]